MLGFGIVAAIVFSWRRHPSALVALSTVDTINGPSAGDSIRFTVGLSNASGLLGAAVTGASFDALLDAAVAANGSNGVGWFQFGGDTYVVEDMSSASLFAAADIAIKLSGVLDLSTATFDAGAHTLVIG